MHQSTPLVVAQITDTHLFANKEHEFFGMSTHVSLKAVLTKLGQVQPRPDLLLMTGDLSQDETSESYIWLRDWVELLAIPAGWVPGNHDIPSRMETILQSDVISPEKKFLAGGWQFLLLSSAVSEQPYGELSSESLAWLEQQLGEERDRPTLIALHHPPVLIGSAFMDSIRLRNPDDLFQVIDRHPQVRIVLFGHIHQEFEDERRGVCYLGTPSTCIQLKPGSYDITVNEDLPGFRLLTLSPDGSFRTWVERVEWRSQTA
ncbi:MAG TPA: 3',5'-cyclic-AMP phosphodiesterase [Crinalium sp.]|jgi:Icc protein